MALAYKNERCRRHGSTWCYDRRCNPRSIYDRRLVEALLAAMWNEDIIPQEEVIETGMPRAKSNPSTMGNAIVMMMDIRRAWQSTEIKPEVRRAMFLHYGQGIPVAHIEGADSYHVARAVTRLQDWLNGNATEEEDEECM